MRRVERERARRHLGHAQPAVDAGEPAREQAIAGLVRVDDDDVFGQIEGRVDRFGETTLDAAANDQPINDELNRVIAAPIELDLLVERAELPVDSRLRVAARAESGKLLLELALAAAHDRREHVDALVPRIQHHHVDDPLERLARDRLAAVRAMRVADVGEEQPEVIVDFGDRADGRARIRSGRLLLDRDGRRQTVDQIDVGLLHLLEELARVRGQRLDVPALTFGIDRVEGERRFAGSRQARDHHELVARDVDVDVLEVVDSRSADRDPVVCHTVENPLGTETLHGNTERTMTR